jgi:glycosyltransferase involved in cell wall biosynthesis
LWKPRADKGLAERSKASVLKKILVEAYRRYPHSYALVAQAHCLSLLRREGFDLRFRDLPARASWQSGRGILGADEERLLGAIPGPDEQFAPDVTLRYAVDFEPPRYGRKFSFATPEYRVLPPRLIAGIKSAAAIPETVHMLTPSLWTAEAFRRFGFGPERLHVVPHGVDPGVLHPSETRRLAARTAYQLDNRFVFLSIGAMTGNKGIDILLRAFARVVQTAGDAHLVLKGADAVYRSKDMLSQTLATLSAADLRAIEGRWTYLGDTLSARAMADLMRAADCYVSPYLAEGFNMPVLEAAACGAAVICTAGGPTDEFTDPSSTWRIRSTPIGVRIFGGKIGEAVKPDFDHLVELMRAALNDRDRTRRMGLAASDHVTRNYTWELVTDRLIAELFPDARQ